MAHNHQATTFSGPLTYVNWRNWLKGAHHKKVAHNTYARLGSIDAHIIIRLIETDIITYFGSGLYSLRNDGWFTATTRRRIEQFSPAYIATCGPDCWRVGDNHSEMQDFKDGIILGGWDLSQWDEERLRQFCRDTARNMGIFEEEGQLLEYEYAEVVLIYSTWVLDSGGHHQNFTSCDPASWIDTHDHPLREVDKKTLNIWAIHAHEVVAGDMIAVVRDFYRKKATLIKRELWERMTVRRKDY